MKLILLGAPGAGKGTQAEIISKRFNVPTISTGEIIRIAIREKTELGIKASEFINQGLLVPDDVVIKMVEDRVKKCDCKDGYILDGFPRTVPQAQALEKMNVKIDKVIYMEVDEEKVIKRLSGRRQCEDCGTIYHIKYKPPKKANICDSCGGNIIIRQDDSVETIKKRLEVYNKQTRPLKEYYSDKKLLAIIKGQENINDTTIDLLKILGVD